MITNTILHQVTLVTEECCSCGVIFAIPAFLQKKLKEKGTTKTFHCPNGHAQHYSESDEDRVTKEFESLILNKDRKFEREHLKVLKLNKIVRELNKTKDEVAIAKRKMRRIS